jgi:transcriptional regulator
LEFFHEVSALQDVVTRLTNVYEAGREKPWSTSELAPDFFAKLSGAIVGFKLEITKLEGKWKLNQNHPQERREKVIAQLAKQPDENSQAIAQLMRESLK